MVEYFSDKIVMCFKFVQFLGSMVIINSNFFVIPHTSDLVFFHPDGASKECVFLVNYLNLFLLLLGFVIKSNQFSVILGS